MAASSSYIIALNAGSSSIKLSLYRTDDTTSPELIAKAQVEEIGEKVYRIAVAVRNDGYLPTNVTEQAIKMKQAKPVEARIHLGEKDTLLVGDAKQEIGHLSSYGGRRKVEWTVRFAGDPTATVEISSKKAGAVRLEVADGLRL